MKSYAIPCMLLLFCSLFLWGATYFLYQVMDDTQTKVDAQIEVNKAKEIGRDAAKRKAEQSFKDSIPVENFIKEWSPYFNNGNDLNMILRELDTISVNLLLSNSEKKNQENRGYPFDGKSETVLRVQLHVSGNSYLRLINWLGKVEEKFPLARTESIAFTVQNNDLSMATVLSFPMFSEFTQKEDKK